MAHFAKVIDGRVSQVIVAEPEFFNTFTDTTPGEWIQTSYNTRGGIHYDPITEQPSSDQTKALRKNFAAVGSIYSPERDAFIPPKPYRTWLLDEQTCLWYPPVPHPKDGKFYKWDDTTVNWIEE